MHSLSRTTWSRKGVAMVLDTAKLKNRKSTILPGMRGRDAARELTLKDDRFLRDQVYRESQLAIGWTEQKCIDELAKQNHTYHLSTEDSQKIPRTMVSHLKQVRQKRAYATWTRFSSCSLSQKTVFIVSQVRKLQNQFLQHNIRRWHSSSSDSWWDTSDWSWWSS